jgi:hypothetical protein
VISKASASPEAEAFSSVPPQRVQNRARGRAVGLGDPGLALEGVDGEHDAIAQSLPLIKNPDFAAVLARVGMDQFAFAAAPA